MNRVCTICARGGSKGVKGKNLLELSGKPLLAYSVEQAIKSGLFVTVAVSSDNPKILECAKDFGANELVARPQELALDNELWTNTQTTQEIAPNYKQHLP